jgi:protein-S-isoprenylcysteine O-methyltransferase
MTLPLSLAILCPVLGISEFGLYLMKRSKANAVSKDRKSLELNWILGSAGFGLATFCAVDLPAWALPWREPVEMSGVCLCVLGLAVRWHAILYLGRLFTVNVAIAADHHLIDSGPYRIIRHPCYAGSLLIILGLGLCMGNFASLLIILVCCFVGCLRRIRVEEEALLEAFGGQYRAYVQRTRRLIPFVY